MYEIIPVFISFYLLAILVIFFITKYQKRKCKILLEKIGIENLKYLEVNYSLTSYSDYKTFGGTFSKKILYYNDDYIFFTHKKNDYFSALFVNLPIIFSKNKSNNLNLSIKTIESIIYNNETIKICFKDKDLTSVTHNEIIIFNNKFTELKEIFNKIYFF